MISSLELGVEWLAAERGSEAERCSFGAVTVRADDQVLTEVIDLLAQTTRPSVRVSCNRLAHWFADHWWRLRWEPQPHGQPSLGWRMAHEMPAIGGGYVWPSMAFSSDGQTVAVQTKPTAAGHTVRFISGHSLVCSAEVFAEAIDSFLAMVLSRQQSCGALDRDLQETWNAVREERADEELASFRKHEAMMGLNPGEVDEAELEKLFTSGAWMGADALDETLVGASEAFTAKALLDTLAELHNRPLHRISFENVFKAARGWSGGGASLEPWLRGHRLAAHLRRSWSLGTGALTDEFLNDLLGERIHSTELSKAAGTPSVAFRDDGYLRPALKRTPHKTTRRFEIARLIADAATAPASDALHPLTNSRTARQKLQRAAAQELLCPVEGLRERLNLPYPDEEEITTVAGYYQVSPLVVRNALVNKKLVDRTYLDSVD